MLERLNDIYVINHQPITSTPEQLETYEDDRSYDNLKAYMDTYRSEKGFYCFCTKNQTEAWKEHFFTDIEELKKFVHIYGDTHDCYLSQATFKKSGTRRTDNVQEINHLFVDIDSDKKRSLNYQECEELLTCFLERVEIEPTLSIFTGHGLQLIWNIQGVSVNEWDTCEKNIHVKVNEALKDIKENSISNLVNALEYCSVHLDNCVSDKARVLRIPGTRNTNDIDPNLYARMMDWNTTTYNKTQLDKIGLNKRKTRDFKAYSNHDRIKIIATETEREKRLTAFQEKQIKPRIDDLIKLIELRNTQGITTGYRNNLIRILTATWQNLGTHPKETRKKLKAVNSMFIKPLEQKELESWLKATYATRKTENGYKKGVRIKSATIILMLEITPEEQKFMKALKDDSTRRKEKKKSENARIKEATRKRKEARNKQIIEMYEKGYSKSEIAQNLGVSRPTVNKVIKNSSYPN